MGTPHLQKALNQVRTAHLFLRDCLEFNSVRQFTSFKNYFTRSAHFVRKRCTRVQELSSGRSVYENNGTYAVCEMDYTAKNPQVAARPLTSCDRHATNKPISGYVRMACHSLLTTNLLQVVNRLVAS